MQIIRNGRRGAFVVAGKQHRLYAKQGQRGNHRGAPFLHSIGQCKESGKVSVRGHIGNGTTLMQIAEKSIERTTTSGGITTRNMTKRPAM